MPPDKPIPDKQSSDFDLVIARQAILKSIEYKIMRWMNSEKSKVKWEVEAEESPLPNSLLEQQLTHTQSEKLAPLPSIYINKSQKCQPPMDKNIQLPQYIDAEWYKPASGNG